MERRTICSAIAGLLLLLPAVVAADDGSRDLDKAIDLKVKARNLRQLTEVADLCESAIKKGLSADDEQFARQLLTGALFTRVRQLCGPLLSGNTPLGSEGRLLRETALKDLRRIVKYGDLHGRGRLLIAQLQMLPGGDRKEAEKAVEAILKLQSSPPEVRAGAYLLKARMATGDAERLQYYNKALQLDARSEDALRARGALYLKQHKTELALRDFDRLLQLRPDDVRTQLAVIQALVDSKQYDLALKRLDHLLQATPDDPDARVLRAELLSRKGEYDKAIADLDVALKKNPDDLSALLRRALDCLRTGRLDKAQKDIDHILTYSPRLPAGLSLRAQLLIEQGKTDEAIPLLRELVEQAPAPDKTIWSLQLAMAYQRANRYQRALDQYNKLLKNMPALADAHRGRADVLLMMDRYKESLADYEIALKEMPDDVNALNNMAWILATAPDDTLRDGKRAIALAEKACKLTDYKKAYILSTLAAAYAETGDFQTALRWINKALEISDEKTRDHLTKEKASYQQKKPWRETKPSQGETPPGPPKKKAAPTKEAKKKTKATKNVPVHGGNRATANER